MRQLFANTLERVVERRHVVRACETSPDAADHLDLAHDCRPSAANASSSICSSSVEGRPSGLKPEPYFASRRATAACTVEPPNQSVGPPGRYALGSTQTSSKS